MEAWKCSHYCAVGYALALVEGKSQPVTSRAMASDGECGMSG